MIIIINLDHHQLYVATKTLFFNKEFHFHNGRKNEPPNFSKVIRSWHSFEFIGQLVKGTDERKGEDTITTRLQLTFFFLFLHALIVLQLSYCLTHWQVELYHGPGTGILFSPSSWKEEICLKFSFTEKKGLLVPNY